MNIHRDQLKCVDGKQDGCSIHTSYIHSAAAATGKVIVDGANAVGSFVTRSTVPWNIAVPPDGINLAYEFLRMSASRSMLNKREKCRGLRRHLDIEIWPKKIRSSTLTLVEQTLENAAWMEPTPSLA